MYTPSALGPTPRSKRGLQSATKITPEALVTVKEALAAGITRGNLRGPAFHPVLRGVHARFDHPDPAGLPTLVKAALKTTNPMVLAASLTALILMGVQIPYRLARDQQIHVLAPTRGAYPERKQLKVHWSTKISDVPKVVTQQGIRSCDPIEAWMQVAKIAHHEELVQLGDQLVRRDNPLTTMAELRRRVAQCAGRRHIRKLRRALEDVRPGTQSIYETWLRRLSLDAGLPEPEINP
ncbi:MAG: hypothetical protein LBJ08_11235, partial [Bifidobacteriaceae bacterium]|nr:hypothetical protein [Bifidobacteriaceae bacterium]